MGWPKTRRTEYVDLPNPILIVCEDKKSAVFYLQDKVRSLRLHSTDVIVDGRSSSAPISVVNYAIERKNRKNESGGLPYERIFCVMDVDNHESLKKAIDKAIANELTPIISNESFELWFLLHYMDYSTASLSRREINSRLSKILGKDYNKGDRGIYDKINIHEAKAWNSSRLLFKHASQNSTQRNPLINPSTEVHLLLEYLHKISKVKEPTSAKGSHI